jgi:hypothetical protein
MKPLGLANLFRRGALRRLAGLSVLTCLIAVALSVAPSGALALTTAQTGAGYPRVSYLWPDSSKYSTTQLARYDTLVLGKWQYSSAAAVRAANPATKVLGCINSIYAYDREVVPAEWFLTQLGSTVSSAWGTGAATVSVADGTRFRAGDWVLCEHEVVAVTSVSGNTLSITRNPLYGYGPANHAAGVRIAPLVGTYAPTLDVRTTCPKVDVGAGPETWAQYNVRRGWAEMSPYNLDGAFLDDASGDPGDWISQGRCRSIDPDRSNRAVTDGYAALDSAFDAGLTTFFASMRAHMPAGILIGNDAYPDYAHMNGTLYETFPMDNGGWWDKSWRAIVMGPRPGGGAAADWAGKGQTPGLSIVWTYQDDGAPSKATATLEFANPDYRKMRFSLTTSLICGAELMYVTAHGFIDPGLHWFDEYDNAGKSKGYLGLPTGPAVEVATGVFRRDFAGGAALVNTNASAATVNLGSTFRKIKGTQAPTVNDGARVSVVTLPARDGLVLLREAGPR